MIQKTKVSDFISGLEIKMQIYANDTLVEIKTNESGILRYKLKPNKEYKSISYQSWFK